MHFFPVNIVILTLLLKTTEGPIYKLNLISYWWPERCMYCSKL